MSVSDRPWAIILGASGGFGLASASLLAENNFNLVLIFRERKNVAQEFNKHLTEIQKKTSCQILTFNGNVIDSGFQEKVLKKLTTTEASIQNHISFFLYAIADGNMKPIIKRRPEIECLDLSDFSHTINSMGTGFFAWVQMMYNANLFAKKTSIVGITSEGAYRVLPDYAAVAASKAVMEAVVKYFAVALGKDGIRVNLINAGITDTNALRVHPSYAILIGKALLRNPSGRLTQCCDIAKVVLFLAKEDSEWINGSTITVDGGEQLIGFNHE